MFCCCLCCCCCSFHGATGAPFFWHGSDLAVPQKRQFVKCSQLVPWHGLHSLRHAPFGGGSTTAWQVQNLMRFHDMLDEWCESIR